jgi:hypothetical protein
MCPLGSRRFGTAWQGLSPVPGQKFIQPVESKVVDAREHVGKPGLRVDIVELGRHDQGRQDGSTLGTTIGAGEQPGLAAQGNSPSIVPISGKMLKSFIAGMRFMDAVFD